MSIEKVKAYKYDNKLFETLNEAKEYRLSKIVTEATLECQYETKFLGMKLYAIQISTKNELEYFLKGIGEINPNFKVIEAKCYKYPMTLFSFKRVKETETLYDTHYLNLLLDGAKIQVMEIHNDFNALVTGNK